MAFPPKNLQLIPVFTAPNSVPLQPNAQEGTIIVPLTVPASKVQQYLSKCLGIRTEGVTAACKSEIAALETQGLVTEWLPLDSLRSTSAIHQDLVERVNGKPDTLVLVPITREGRKKLAMFVPIRHMERVVNANKLWPHHASMIYSPGETVQGQSQTGSLLAAVIHNADRSLTRHCTFKDTPPADSWNVELLSYCKIPMEFPRSVDVEL